MRAPSKVAALLLSAATAFLWSGQAAATPRAPQGDRLVVLGSGDAVPVLHLSVDRIAPGGSTVQQFRLHLTGNVVGGQPAVVLDHLRNLERGCNHPEIAAGDVTCGGGDDQGELGGELLVGVTAQAAGPEGCLGATAAPAMAPMTSLAGVTLTPGGPAVADGPDTCLTLQLALPASADNLVQSDAVDFDLQIGLVDSRHADDLVLGGGTGGAARGPVGSLGSGTASADGHLGGTVDGPTLPFTGLPLRPFLLAAAALLAAALLAVVAGRRRTGPHPG